MPSSVIRKFEYDPAAHKLSVTFVTGRRYAYLGVPEEVANEFRKAFSKGEFFNDAIRDHYLFERLGQDSGLHRPTPEKEKARQP